MSKHNVGHMLAALAAVKALHSPFEIYDECPHDDHKESDPGVLDIDDVGLTCAEGLIQTVCRECDTHDGEVHEDSSEGIYPCRTLQAIAKATEP